MKSSDIKREEQLSALLDNGLDADQLQDFMQDLKRDPVDDAERSQRYRMIGDAMRDELDVSSFMDISASVHRAIEQEPDCEPAPLKSVGVLQVISQRMQQWLKPLTGAAVAASVAMLTVFSFNAVQTEKADESLQVAQQAVPQKVSPEISRNVRVASTVTPVKRPLEQQKQLNSYMLQHSGYASQATMQGMMPYVRAADLKAQETVLEAGLEMGSGN